MRVQYFISAGTIPDHTTAHEGKRLKDALNAFADYIEQCKAENKPYVLATMLVQLEGRAERLFEIGPRGGIVENLEY